MRVCSVVVTTATKRLVAWHSSSSPCLVVVGRTLSTETKAASAVVQEDNINDPQKKKISQPTFFGYTSGRARRRRRRLLQFQQREEKKVKRKEDQERATDGFVFVDEFYFDDKEDTRTVRDILWPNPFKDEPLPPGWEKTKWPTTYKDWKFVLTKTWDDYWWTWRGVWASKGIFVEDPLDKVDSSLEETTKGKGEFETKTEEIAAQAKANAKLIKEEALSLRQQVRERTGIHNQEDLRKLAAEMMRLASECVAEFMKGYRKGRDDEVEKMLTRYFEELEKEANKPRKRRKKRRVLNRRHPLAT